MTNWWKRLKQGLKKSSDNIGGKIREVFLYRRVDEDTLSDLEDLLIQSDIGIETSSYLCQQLSLQKFPKDTPIEDILKFLATSIENILHPLEKPFLLSPEKLNVILVIGVNGSGKTTTISKLTQKWLHEGFKVEIAACDTFRAAAIDQLQVWADRLKVHLYKTQEGHDASGLAFEAVQKAQQKGTEVLIIDTAGRLHNKEHLMKELEKIDRVIKKASTEINYQPVLVLDATVGQNAHQQIEIFNKAIPLSGFMITKLDGTAKGGVVVSLAKKYNHPLFAIGVGEQAQDLQPFNAHAFAHALVGLEDA